MYKKTPRPTDLIATETGGWALLDAGNERKLERFGDTVIDRPAPQAIWAKAAAAPWDKAQAMFKRSRDGSGRWVIHGQELPPWKVSVADLVFEVRLTGFGNVGLFPEHAVHWDWMSRLVSTSPGASVLNLFAYTGGASMACARAGAKITHVDAAKSVNAWARTNSALSALQDGQIRYLADEALKLAKRELRRKNRYQGIILDPPTFGRGPKGEVWKIERDLEALLETCFGLLSETPLFILVTSHSPGVTPSVLRALFRDLGGELQSGEMLLGGEGHELPAGAYLRWTP